MIDRDHKLPISRQAELLDISRGSVYYQGQEASPEDLKLMRRMDELHLNYPFAGSRMLRDMLRFPPCRASGATHGFGRGHCHAGQQACAAR